MDEKIYVIIYTVLLYIIVLYVNVANLYFISFYENTHSKKERLVKVLLTLIPFYILYELYKYILTYITGDNNE